jgi:hypothetical protein
MSDIAPQVPPRKRRRWLLWISAGAVAAVALLVVFLPAIISSPLFRGVITDAVAAQVNGKVTIGGVSLSWFGPQSVENVSIVGDDGKSSVQVSASLRASVFDLLGDLRDLDATASGKVAGAIAADGTLSLASLAKAPAKSAASAPKPAPAAGASSAQPRPSIHLTIDGFDATIANAAGPSFAVEGLKGKIAVGATGPIEVQLAARTKIGDKPGAISANGTLDHAFNAAGAFDPIAITGSLKAEVDGVLVPAAGAAIEVSQAKLAVDAAAGKPIDLAADVGLSVDGSAAAIHAKVQAERPTTVSAIASWARDPRTWSGSISAQQLPTAMLEKFVAGTPVVVARDLGPTVSLTLATNSSTGFDLSLTAAQARLKCSAAIDVATGAVQGKATQLDASLSPALLSRFNVVTPQPLPLSVSLQSFSIPPPLATGQFNLAQVTAQGAISVGAAQFTSAGNAPVAMGPISVTMAAAPLAEAVHVALQTTLNGAPIDAKADLTGLMQGNAFAAKQAKAAIVAQVGPVDPTLLPGVPSNIVEMLRHVQPGASTVKANMAGSFEQGALDLNIQTAPGVINAKANWDATSAAVTLENTTLTVQPAVVEWASGGAVKLSAPATCKVAVGPVKMDRAALQQGTTAFLPSPVSIFADKLQVSHAPGLAGALVVQNAVVRGTIDLDGPKSFEGTVTTTAAIANGLPGGAGNAAIGDLSVQASLERDANAPGSTVAVTVGSLALSGVQGFAETVIAKNVHATFAGPLSMAGASASTLSLDVLGSSGLAAKVAGDFKTQPDKSWSAAATASEVSMQRIAQLLGMGEVPEWTSGGAANAGKLKADLSSKSGALAFAVNADLGRVSAAIKGSRAADGSITLAQSSAAASVPGGAVKNYLDARPQKTPIRNISDLKVALEISALTLPSVNGKLEPLAAGAALAAKARVEPFQLTFAPESLMAQPDAQAAGKPGAKQPAASGAAAQPEKLATLDFGATDLALKTSGAESAQLDVNGAFASGGQPAKPMTVKARAQNLAGRDGKFDAKGMKLAADVNISEFPSSIVDAITKGDGFIPNLAGPVFSVTLTGQTGFDASDKFKGHVESPTISLDIPAVRINGGQMSVVPAEAITLQIRPDDTIRQKILRPINPTLAEIEFKKKSINARVTEVRAPLPFDMAQTDARFVIEIGEVELEKKGQIISLLNLATVKDGKSTIPGLVSPLNGEINKGILTYKDFTIQAGKQGETWQQKVISDANINLTTKPAYANAINVRYPLEGVTNAVAANAGLNSVMGEINKALGNTTAEMRQAIQLKVIFSGPLQGDQLKMTVEPALDLKSGDDLIKGLGGIADGILKGKSGGATTPGTTPASKSPTVGDVLDLFKKKPK